MTVNVGMTCRSSHRVGRRPPVKLFVEVYRLFLGFFIVSSARNRTHNAAVYSSQALFRLTLQRHG